MMPSQSPLAAPPTGFFYAACPHCPLASPSLSLLFPYCHRPFLCQKVAFTLYFHLQKPNPKVTDMQVKTRGGATLSPGQPAQTEGNTGIVPRAVINPAEPPIDATEAELLTSNLPLDGNKLARTGTGAIVGAVALFGLGWFLFKK